MIYSYDEREESERKESKVQNLKKFKFYFYLEKEWGSNKKQKSVTCKYV